ncbi:hypothetical protein D7X55_00520 [Corallococcus sp. AB049A]|uniref:hypothetical protein n=1 Tax=Corallococcus sp. AB049A TaxID=2316721 RepID=UPI000EC65B35|nr:hypothetical protein [Corallococcus sp. AB049A]RKI75252.1 hypothetical protein D7X55_00520 [Corallococcus sp. AB049A]
MDRKDDGSREVVVGTQYPLGQLARALQTTQEHPDAEARARAQDKVRAWTEVFSGMLQGTLAIGSRVPVAEVPSWATLEVAKGGFATGRLLAEGDLQPHEQALLSRLQRDDDTGSARAVLNAWYLGEEGLAELRRMLQTGGYRIQVPEEGALLVVAWLLDHDQAERARSLLDQLAPFFPRLRFYPVPATTPQSDTAFVHVREVEATRAALKQVRARPALQRQWESARVWTPLYDRLVALWAGALREAPLGFQLDADFKQRTHTLLSDIDGALTKHTLCAWPRKPQLSFGRLLTVLKDVVHARMTILPGQARRVRGILDAISQARGLPGSERLDALRTKQRELLERPSVVDFAREALRRLDGLPGDTGLDSLEALTAPVKGFAIPASIERKVRLSLNAPVETLVEQRLIRSSETLARVVPQLSAQVRALGISQPSLRALYAALYTAFRRRRSLLLLNLESQVKLEELPWVAAIDAYRKQGLTQESASRQTLEQLLRLTLGAFPEVLLPNKLLQEVRALLKSAGLQVPVVDELAADIFMGTFTEKFLEAAQQAQELLAGTLYARYYDLPSGLREMNASKHARHEARTSEAFAALCTARAKDGEDSARWSPAANGRIIEQAQILTTHNLATLVEALDLRPVLEPQLEALALRCFTRVCELLEARPPGYHSRLRNLKNAAYAWRHMLFFLSLRPEATHPAFLQEVETRLSQRRGDLPQRLAPAMLGLRHVVGGGQLKDAPPGARCFLGWTLNRHWALGTAP